jgi:UDP-3-O-[3-hydroxymyristoyl] glucosamine N-acyltransferase
MTRPRVSGVAVGVGVRLGVSDVVGVYSGVGVSVGVAVAVLVGDDVAVGARVVVAEAVDVGVIVGVGDGPGREDHARPPANPAARRTPAPRRMRRFRIRIRSILLGGRQPCKRTAVGPR